MRLPTADAYAAQVEKEHRWLPLLAPRLPLPIPEPLAKGRATGAFPRPWSIYRWLPGAPATERRVSDPVRLARDLAGFVTALQRIDAGEGPAAGEHSFFRGGPLATYDEETRASIDALGGDLDARAATDVWDAALAAGSRRPPVWVHGDITPSNLLVENGRLTAVIDFGCSAVGDPACDLAIAWTFFAGESRAAFRTSLSVDDPTWARGRGWALWKALVTLRKAPGADAAAQRMGWRLGARDTLAEVLRGTVESGTRTEA